MTVFEKGADPGGNLQTLRADGWQLEWGPNGFLDNEPATLRLVDRLGLRDQLQRSSDATALYRVLGTWTVRPRSQARSVCAATSSASSQAGPGAS